MRCYTLLVRQYRLIITNMSYLCRLVWTTRVTENKINGETTNKFFLFHETWTRQTEIYICNIYLYFLYYFFIFSILCNIFRIELILILTMARNCLASHFAQHALKLGHKSHKNMCICCILLSTLQSCRIIPNPLVVQSF
jgi:hypothetical protein